MESRVAGSFGGGRKALTGLEAGRSGRCCANFSKVVRVKHVSEVPAVRVGVWPGEGSVRAACRKMVLPLSQPPVIFKDPSSRITLSRGVFTAHLEPLRVNYLLRLTIRTPKPKADARPNARVNLSFHSELPSLLVRLSPVATSVISSALLTEDRSASLRNDFSFQILERC